MESCPAINRFGANSNSAYWFRCTFLDFVDGMVPQQVIPIVEAVTDAIAAEIQRSVDFFMATSGETELQRIYLTGGSAHLHSLSQAIEKRSRVSVEVWNPVERMMVDYATVNGDLLRTCGNQLSVALGLALRKEREERT